MLGRVVRWRAHHTHHLLLRRPHYSQVEENVKRAGGVFFRLFHGRTVMVEFVGRAVGRGAEPATTAVLASPTTEQPTATPTIPAEGSVSATPNLMPSPMTTPTAIPTGSGVPMFRGDPPHTGVNRRPGFERSPRLVWCFETGGWVRSSPAVVGAVVYIGSDDNYVYALAEE